MSDSPRIFASDTEREALISQVMARGFDREDAEYIADFPDTDMFETDPATGRPRVHRGPTLEEMYQAQDRKEPPHGED